MNQIKLNITPSNGKIDIVQFYFMTLNSSHFVQFFFYFSSSGLILCILDLRT